MATEDYLKEFITIFFAQKKIVIQTTIVIFISAILVAVFWPPTYMVRGSILVKNRQLSKSPEAIEDTETRVWEVDQETLNSEMKIITSVDVIEDAVRYLIDHHQLKPGRGKATDDYIAEKVENIQNHLKTEIAPASKIIIITYFSRDRLEAKTILDAVMNQYISFRVGIYHPGEAQSFFKDQADQFVKGIDEKNAQLIELSDKYQTANPEKEIQNNLELVGSLEKELDLALRQKSEKELMIAYLDKLVKAKGIQFFSSVVNEPINLLSIKLQDLYVERGDLLRIYAEESTPVKRIDEQIGNTYKSLKNEVVTFIGSERQRLNILNEQIEILQIRLTELTKRNLDLYRSHVTQTKINTEVGVLQQSYQVFAKRSEEARISGSANAGSLFAISVLNRPATPVKPYFPDKSKVIPLGLIVGFILGCSLGFIQEYFDHTFKSPQDALRYASLPAIFSIPDYTV